MMKARDASLKKFRRSKLDTDLAAYRLLWNKVSARLLNVLKKAIVDHYSKRIAAILNLSGDL